jgi:Tfp pilus assembly protein PilO
MKLSKRDTLLLLVVALVVGVGGFYWFYVKPAKKDLDAKQAQVAQVQTQNDDLRDTIARLERDSKSLAGSAAARLRYAKAVPDAAQVPGAIYQIQRLADRANVDFDALSTGAVTELGGFAGRAFQMKVTGKFFDVDDFLYRLHRQVTVDAKGRAQISGRLFAVTKVEIAAGQKVDGKADTTTTIKPGDAVTATLDVVVFSTSTAAATPSAGTSPAIVSPHVGQASEAPNGGTR